MKNKSVLILILLLVVVGLAASIIERESRYSQGATALETYKGRLALKMLPKNYSVDMAIAAGDYVNVHDKISNEHVMRDFIDSVQNKQDAFVRTVRITVEGDPIITDFLYKNDSFKVAVDTSRDKFRGRESPSITNNRYKRLLTYEAKNRKFYVVTNLDALSIEASTGDYGGLLLMYVDS